VNTKGRGRGGGDAAVTDRQLFKSIELLFIDYLNKEAQNCRIGYQHFQQSNRIYLFGFDLLSIIV